MVKQVDENMQGVSSKTSIRYTGTSIQSEPITRVGK